MKCSCCNEDLTDAESTARLPPVEGQPVRYADTCRKCLQSAGVAVRFRPDFDKRKSTREYLDDPLDLGETDDVEEW